MAIRTIVVLGGTLQSGNDIEGTICFRLTVPAALAPYAANPAATSAVPDATAEELAALQAGTIVEQVVTGRDPSAATTQQIQGGLLQTLALLQAQLDATAPPVRYTAMSWDGAAWSNVPAGG